MTIFDIALGPDGTVWLASSGGIWRGTAGDWSTCAALPLVPAALLCLPDGDDLTLLAGGDPPGVLRSIDRGQRWQPSWIDEVERPITCLAASPRFAADRVLLAGTAASGVLRSIDGGRHWRLANAGLHDGALLALATVPAWDERELVLAATASGLYRSPNGGRAWQRCAGLENEPIQALAVSATSIYAGSESGALLRSLDAGLSWQPLTPPGRSALNCLWLSPDDPTIVLAGTADGALLRSADGGLRWDEVAASASAVLALAGSTTLYAGHADGSLLVSIDQGVSWTTDQALPQQSAER